MRKFVNQCSQKYLVLYDFSEQLNFSWSVEAGAYDFDNVKTLNVITLRH